MLVPGRFYDVMRENVLVCFFTELDALLGEWDLVFAGFKSCIKLTNFDVYLHKLSPLNQLTFYPESPMYNHILINHSNLSFFNFHFLFYFNLLLVIIGCYHWNHKHPFLVIRFDESTNFEYTFKEFITILIY